MKNALKEKFKNNALVKPLYRKLKNRNKIKPKILVDSTFKLDGGGISVIRNITTNNGGVTRKTYLGKRFLICGSSENNKKRLFDKVIRKEVHNEIRKGHVNLANKMPKSEVDGIEAKSNKLVQADNEVVVVQKVANTWLRLYPLPTLPEESVVSVIFRCILCQLGLCSILVLWTTIWVFVIHSFEGPFELKVSLDFEKQQKLLVIDLATELRQIAPLSLKWRHAIERRIQDERRLTMEAISQGARVQPGQFWDLSGTFLFTVYVMTALGFGVPVPKTTWGRTSALIYAIFAVPTHVYLMLNASMCIMVRVETYLDQLRCNLRDQRSSMFGRTTLRNGVSPNCSRSSEVLKAPNRRGIGKKILRFLSVLGACRCIPFVAVLYYVCGAVSFGLARRNTALDIALFPLEFTTTGGLDRVEGHVRILYGWYVEGAMMLLSCGLATLRRHSSAAVSGLAEKYRLLDTNN